MPNSTRRSSRHPTKAPHVRRRTGVGPVVALLVIPLLLILVDPDAPHRAGSPRGPLARLRVRLARWIAPGPADDTED